MKRRTILSSVGIILAVTVAGCSDDDPITYLDASDLLGSGWTERPANVLGGDDVGYRWRENGVTLFVVSGVRSFDDTEAAEQTVSDWRRDIAESEATDEIREFDLGDAGFSAYMEFPDASDEAERSRSLALFRVDAVVALVELSLAGEPTVEPPIEVSIEQAESLARKKYNG